MFSPHGPLGAAALAQQHAMPGGQEQLHGTAGPEHGVQLCNELLTFGRTGLVAGVYPTLKNMEKSWGNPRIIHGLMVYIWLIYVNIWIIYG